MQMRTIIICINLQEKALKKLLLLALLFPVSALAEEYKLVIKDHQFQPAEITIPSGTKVKLLVENQDSTPEEFESYSLNREKIVAGNSRVTLFIGPLSAGKYTFFGEFNPKTAQGIIIVK
jgi:plastocyanin